MSEDTFDIICHGCRASVPSTAHVCPKCGESLFAFETPSRAQPVHVPVRAATPSKMPLRPPPPRRNPAYRALPDSAYAGFWIRVLAQLIDVLLIFASFLILRRLVGERTSPIYPSAISWSPGHAASRGCTT